MKNANGVTGYLLNQEGEWTFRVYHESGFTDYELRHCDLCVTIIDDDAYFYEDAPVLDYSPETLGITDDEAGVKRNLFDELVEGMQALREERMKVKPINTEKANTITNTITIKPNAWQMYTQVGWVCPVCGKGNAPTTTSCGCKSSTKGTALPTRKAVKVKPINTEKEYKAAIARTTELLAAEPKPGWSEDDEELKLLYREMQDYELRRSDVAPASVMKRLGLWWKKHFVVNNESKTDQDG